MSRSNPAQKLRPWPRTTTIATRESAATSPAASSNAATSARSSALSLSGRFRAIVARSPSICTTTSRATALTPSKRRLPVRPPTVVDRWTRSPRCSEKRALRRRVADRPVGGDDRELRQRVPGEGAVGPDVPDRPSQRRQPVGDQPPVAAPPRRLGAHERRRSLARQDAQLGERGGELV